MLPREYDLTRTVLTDATPGAAVDSSAIAETLAAYAPDIVHHIQTALPGGHVLVQVTTEGAWVGISQTTIPLPAPESPLLELRFPADADHTLDQLLGEIATWKMEHDEPDR